MDVPIRHDGEQQVIIDLPALGGEADAWGYKPLGAPPAEGIDDCSVAPGQGAPALDRGDAHRRSARSAPALFGIATENVDLRVRIEQPGVPPYEAAVERALVPFYAAHLAEPGSRLAGLVRDGHPGNVKVDWPASALADPGIGPPARERARLAARARADGQPAKTLRRR